MKRINPYLTFAGNCREALDFYKTCFNGEIVSIETFGEANFAQNESMKDKIIHAEFKAEEIYFMASDAMPDFKANPGNMLTMSLSLSDKNEQAKIFDALADGGTVTMPLDIAFWGEIFGMVTDRFGIHWMLSCPTQ